jgi:hypothetical protein
MVLTAYAVLSPATNSSCHRHRRIKVCRPGRADVASADLAPATGARTTRFCRTRAAFTNPQSAMCCRPHFSKGVEAPFVRTPFDRSRETRPAKTTAPDAAASTASRPAFVTIASRPSLGTGQSGYRGDFSKQGSGKFFAWGLDKNCLIPFGAQTASLRTRTQYPKMPLRR